MVLPKIIQKSINNKTYYYDIASDVISDGEVHLKSCYDRTQVQLPVDLCIEVTTRCQMACSNCFSNSGPRLLGNSIDFYYICNFVVREADNFIRIVITGGEPLLHPNINEIIEFPGMIPDCGFVLNTNGLFGEYMDGKLCDFGWLVAFSLHGREKAHNEYTRSNSFRHVCKRIMKMASHGIVHIYCVLHDGLCRDDIDWLFKFRDEAGVKFLRFITPRPFGRYKPFNNKDILEYVITLNDTSSGLKVNKSLTKFLSVEGHARLSN